MESSPQHSHQNREREIHPSAESLKEFFTILDEYRSFNKLPFEQQREEVKIPLDQRLSKIQSSISDLGLRLEMFDRENGPEPGFAIGNMALFNETLERLSHETSVDAKEAWTNLLIGFQHQALFDYKHDESDERLEDLFLASESMVKHAEDFADAHRNDGRRDERLNYFIFGMRDLVSIMRKGWLKEYKILYPSGIFYRIQRNTRFLALPEDPNYQNARGGYYEQYNQSCIDALKKAVDTKNPNATEDLATYVWLFRRKLEEDKNQLDTVPYLEDDKRYFREVIEKLDAQLQTLS